MSASPPKADIVECDHHVRFVYLAFVSQALARIMPNAWVEQAPNTGHSVAYQRAEVFNRITDGFLSKIG